MLIIFLLVSCIFDHELNNSMNSEPAISRLQSQQDIEVKGVNIGHSELLSPVITEARGNTASICCQSKWEGYFCNYMLEAIFNEGLEFGAQDDSFLKQ